MSFFDRFGPFIFCRVMEKTRPMREKIDGKMFIFCQGRHFFIVDNFIKLLFRIFTLTWPVNNYISRQGKGINRRTNMAVI